jgi:hypothetical protein
MANLKLRIVPTYKSKSVRNFILGISFGKDIPLDNSRSYYLGSEHPVLEF